ncbi:MAG: lipoyl synthase [Desulfonatronovibrio sp.]
MVNLAVCQDNFCRSKNFMNSKQYLRKPEWLRVRLPASADFARVDKDLENLHLNTVCRSANCPNIFECFSRKTATFLILGNVCTRNCRFCNVSSGRPEIVDPSEPERISEAVSKLGLKHVVITSVTRDDLEDGGAGHFAEVLNTLKKDHPGSSLEVLVPDFKANRKAIDRVLNAGPDVYGHNLETAGRLYPEVRSGADYTSSLNILSYVRKSAPGIRVKTGIMAGLGETDHEIMETMEHAAGHGCQMLTIGQYLRPSTGNLAVRRYVAPEKFAEYERAGEKLGMVMFCGPLVRSSYHADNFRLSGN